MSKRKFDILTKKGLAKDFSEDIEALNGSLSLYQKTNEKNTPGGYAGLDDSGKLLETVLPALAITQVYLAANQTEQDQINAQTGDIVIRADLNKSFIYTGSTWTELLNPPAPVTSVDGRTGNVTLEDLYAQIVHYHAGILINDGDILLYTYISEAPQTSNYVNSNYLKYSFTYKGAKESTIDRIELLLQGIPELNSTGNLNDTDFTKISSIEFYYNDQLIFTDENPIFKIETYGIVSIFYYLYMPVSLIPNGTYSLKINFTVSISSFDSFVTIKPDFNCQIETSSGIVADKSISRLMLGKPSFVMSTVLYQKIGENENNITTLQNTTSDLDTRVNDNKNNITTLQNTTSDLDTRVNDNENSITTLQSKIYIPELSLWVKRLRPDTVSGNVADELYVYWNSMDDRFMQYNPEVWLFRWKRNQRKITISNTAYKKQKRHWIHTPHHNGTKWSDTHPSWYAGKTIVNGTEYDYDTEFPLPDKAVLTQLPWNPYQWFQGTIDETTSLGTAIKFKGYSKHRVSIVMGLAIVINNPGWDGSDNSVNPKLFGPITKFRLYYDANMKKIGIKII